MSEISPSDANAGKRLGGYEILKKVGQGGMGAVFQARQISMDRVVALKILPPKLARDPQFVQRFLREARSAGQIQHPNLINVYDCGQAGEYYYFSMEFVPGQTLKQVLATAGPLDAATAIAHMKKVAQALQAAHAKGIVHRDVKPENILLDQFGEPKLADLGLAKPMSGDADVTLGGTALGTPHYMAPEQAKGETVDGRCDLYALGATFHHLLTGKRLFEAPTAAGVMVKHATEAPPVLRSLRPDLPAGLEKVLSKCLRKKADERYVDAAALIADLDRLERGEAVGASEPRLRSSSAGHAAHPPGQRVRTTREVTPAKSNTPLFIGLGAGGVLTLGVIIALVAGGGDKPAPKPAPTPTVAQAPPVPTLTTTTTPTPTPTSTTKPAQGAAEMLAFAKDHLARNPSDFAKGREYLLAAQKAGANTVVAMQADQELAKLDAAWTAQARSAFATVATTAQELATVGKADEALAAIAGFDADLAKRAAPVPQDLAAKITADATAAIEAKLAEAEAALAAQKPDEAEAALAASRAIACAPAQTALAQRRDALTAAIAAKRQELATAAAGAWAKFEESLLNALVEGRLDEAKDQAAKAQRDPANAAARPKLQAVEAVVASLAAREAIVVEKVKGLVGQQVEIQRRGNGDTVKGLLSTVDDKGLRIDCDVIVNGRKMGSSKATVPWNDLHSRHIAEFQKAWVPNSPDDHAAAACAALRAGDLVTVEVALTRAGSHPLAPSLTERARVLKLGAAEVACEKAWKALAGKDPAGMAEAAAIAYLKELDDLKQTQGGTTTFAGIADAWQQKRDAAFARTAEGRLKAGLILHLRFDDPHPKSWKDSSPFGDTLAIGQNAWLIRFDRGISGTALTWTRDPTKEVPGYGFGLQVDGPFRQRWAKATALTYHTWVKLVADPGKRTPADFRYQICGLAPFQMGGPFCLNFHMESGCAALQDMKPDTTAGPSSKGMTRIDDGAWHLLSVVFDGAKPETERYRWYIDGKPEGTLASWRTAMPEDGGLLFNIYSNHDRGNMPTWMHDELRIYTRAHGPDEVAAVMAVSRMPPPPQPVRLVIFNGTNDKNSNAGVKTCTVRFLKGATVVKEVTDLAVAWTPYQGEAGFPSTPVDGPDRAFDTVQIDISAWQAQRPCLTELQLSADFENLFKGAKISGTPGFHPNYDLPQLLDGGFGDGRYWLPAKGEPARIIVTLAKPWEPKTPAK